MAISPELLKILRCPKCKSELKLKDDGSGLRCLNPECALVYPVRDDIPVMIIEEAAKETGASES
ncbi:MAG: Trm112 family protein [Acidobacteriota bacterium]|nr:MAG: Trm112 family protein [Acidobacteriota bacterium]